MNVGRRSVWLACVLGLVGACRDEDTARRDAAPGEPDAAVMEPDAGPPEADGGPVGEDDDAGDRCCAIWGPCVGALDDAGADAGVIDLDRDADGDGIARRTDCDDADPEVHPGFGGAQEEGPWGAPTCCDGKDNDCDGVIDGDEEGFSDGCCHMWAPCMDAASS
jgi:hypothetical protein